jgi:asparagine synthase (glutamine-hydrolysing)
LRHAAGVFETRAPSQDHRRGEFAGTLPRLMLFGRNTGKKLRRKVLHRQVPAALVARPKMGIGVPAGERLTGTLRDWIEDMSDPAGMNQAGIVDSRPIAALWENHLAGRGGHKILYGMF